ncbi:MAG TPA: glycosyltransferase family 39 protein [Methylomirabilota bacterium]|nr:glycosyltransferase family 39 protein [Methylomirabilota bacterium]
MLWLIAAGTALRLAAGWWAGLCYGESYYFACARHPSPAYFDHPPLSILLAAGSLHLTGEVGHLTLRWPFIALFAGTTWLLFALGRRLFGAWPGFFAALLMNLAPVFSLSVGIFLQPDGPLMFFWLACAACLARLLLGPPPRRPLLWWAAAGAMLGLDLLSKYSAVLLVAGAALYVLARRDQRRWLAHPGPYLALAVAALLFSPVLVWNARHHWISFLWQSTRGLDELQGIRLDWMLRNIGGQSVELLPWVWILLMAELIISFRRHATLERRFVACLAVLPIVLFTAVAAYAATGQRHFHWGMPGYLLLFLPAGETIHRQLARGSAAFRRGLGATVALSLGLMTLAASHVATGWLKDGPRWLSAALAGDKDPTLECIDFTALEPAFAERGLLGRGDLFVFSDWWFRAGKVDYGLKGRLPVLALSRTDPRSFAFFDRPERWLGKDGILVTTKTSVEEVSSHYGAYFARISALGPVEIGRHGRREITLYLYRCEELTRPYPLPYG